MQCDLVLGKVISIDSEYPKDEFVIKVDIVGSNKSVRAYPIITLDEPRPDDEVVLIGLSNELNNSYLYIPLRKFKSSKPFNGLEYNKLKIELTNKGKLIVENDKENLMDLTKDLIKFILNIKILVTGSTGILHPSKIPELNEILVRYKKLLK